MEKQIVYLAEFKWNPNESHICETHVMGKLKSTFLSFKKNIGDMILSAAKPIWKVCCNDAWETQI